MQDIKHGTPESKQVSKAFFCFYQEMGYNQTLYEDQLEMSVMFDEKTDEKNWYL